ncbi:molybdopterin-dependent oxidoreductase [Dactylosporangium cerinum]|uniref:Molybdopterin-dependent oxidoreductase n=1 Tax=Dactylosporangium cerinum TaxID=1434730 RepID=A0ABV9W367_9ACTN
MVRPPDALTALSRRFTSPLRSPRLTAHLGLWLAAAFTVCFATGLLSHAIQHPPGWFHWPARPVQLYRITQGLHIATGLACFPLLTAKVWSVFPKLFAWPPARSVPHALERGAVALLSGAALFELVTGLLNIAYWYPLMPFGFVGAHYWTAWLLIGAMLMHVAAKLPVIATAPPADRSRRGVLALVGAAAGVITVATVGQTVRPLRRLSVLAPRLPDVGPQGLPVNKTAAAAGVTTVDGDYRLTVSGPGGRHSLSLTDLAALPQHTVSLPIACVEGWSATADWTGVRVVDLLRLVGAADVDLPVAVESLQPAGAYRTSTLEPGPARDPLTLLALRVGGAPLHPDHGYPCRLIAPNRPGVLQTKWVGALTVLSA